MGGCRNKRLIGPYLDRQLGDCHWLDEHISECSECLAEYELIQRLNHLAQKADFSPPESIYWRNFSTRAMARIVTRQTQTTSLKARLFLGSFKIPIRAIGYLSVLIIVGVTGISIYNHRGHAPDMASNQTIPQNNQAVQTNQDNSIAVSLTTQPPNETNAIPTNIGNQAITSTASVDGNQEKTPGMPIIDNINITGGLAGDFRAGNNDRASLVESDLPAGLELVRTDIVNPSSDQVIAYQINYGSRAGEIPFAAYRLAAAKFYGPEKSAPWRSFSGSATPTLGYASGQAKMDSQSDQRLNMELDLSKDK